MSQAGDAQRAKNDARRKAQSDEFIRTHSRTNQKAKPPRKAPPKKAPPKDPEFKNLNTISAQPMTEKQFYKHYK